MYAEFFYISGRGWVTVDEAHCPTCKQRTGRAERKATTLEWECIIEPLTKKHPTANRFFTDNVVDWHPASHGV